VANCFAIDRSKAVTPRVLTFVLFLASILKLIIIKLCLLLNYALFSYLLFGCVGRLCLLDVAILDMHILPFCMSIQVEAHTFSKDLGMFCKVYDRKGIWNNLFPIHIWLKGRVRMRKSYPKELYLGVNKILAHVACTLTESSNWSLFVRSF
jgi:hypothetical protein